MSTPRTRVSPNLPPPVVADRRVDLFGRMLDELVEARDGSGTSAAESSLDWLADAGGEAEAFALESAALEARIGSQVGPYRLTALLGRGGMGAVFAAERIDGAFSQQVALKLLRLGGSGPRVASRFRRERAILAGLEHPHIARLLDGGMSAEGEPWFAMERIDGSSLIDHCASRSLSLAQRVELFLQSCDAVAYAHRNLIVHRDLKPANVMVTHDGAVKLLDFGIAKLVDRAAAETLTALDERVMTPDYAAPEQVLGRPVTTATDVYALGLLLFEMLTGERAQQSAGRSLIEVERCVVNLEVPRPSTRATPYARQLRGDLDAIVGKALRKEPELRYDGALALADDLRRWRDGGPVAARGGARSYRVARFVRRHRLPLAAAASIVLALALGLVATLSQVREARSQALRAETTRQFVVDLFRSVDPGAAENHGGVDALRLIDGGLERLRDRPDMEPGDRAELLLTLADMYDALGRYDRGLELTEDALVQQRTLWSNGDVRLIPVLAVLAARSASSGRLEAASARVEEAEALLQRAGTDDGEQHLRLLQTRLLVANRMGDFRAAHAIASSILALQTQRHGADSPETGVALVAIGWAYSWQNRYDEAERAYRRALALPRGPAPDPNDPGMEATPQWLHLRLGHVAEFRGRYAEALAEYQLAHRLRVARFGPEHTMSRAAAMYIAHARSHLGHVEESEAEMRRLRATSSWQFADWMLGRLLAVRGKLDEAEPLLRAAYQRARTASGDEAKLTQFMARDLGDVLTERGAHGEARAVLDGALRVLERIETRDSHQYAQAESRLARLMLAVGDAAGAEARARHAWTVQRGFLGPDIDESVRARHELGRALVALGRHDEGVTHLAAAAEASTAQYGPDDVRGAEHRFVLGEALAARGDAGAAAVLAPAARLLVAAPSFTRPVRERAERWLAKHGAAS